MYTGITPLSLSDLVDVCDKVFSVRQNWYYFGLALKLPSDTLDTIESKYCEKHGDCLREMLKARLKLKSKLTWRDIIRALRRPSVGENKLAEQLEGEYGPQKPSAEGENNSSRSIQSRMIVNNNIILECAT